MTPLERKQLIDALLEGEISEADALRIEAELSVDATARQAYYERVALTSLLEMEAGGESAAAPGSGRVIPLPVSAVRWRQAFVGMAAAAVVCLGVIGLLLNSIRNGGEELVANGPGAVTTEENSSGFAVVAGQAGAVWGDGMELADGALVPPGLMQLESGVVQFELFSGVSVVVEGAAEFAVLSPMEMTVTRGKVRAHVPEPAHGFRIRTEEGEVVDLGTDFAVDVSDGRSEVHVLDGEVEWHPRAQGMRKLERGEAVQWFAGGQGAELAADAGSFVGATELREQLATSRRLKRENWQRFSEDMGKDARLLAYYQVGAVEGWNRRLPNRAKGSDQLAGEGAIVAAARSADRWGRPDGALDFSPAGSRVRLSVPGEHGSLTLTCWVKINSLDRWYNSLFLTDGHDLHEPHWQIMDDGRLFFSVKKNDTWDASAGEKDKHIYYSPSFWTPALSGQWLMLATVYDVDVREVTHYLNGLVLSREATPEKYLVEKVSIGNASLGNWGLPEREDPRFAVRNLNGSMDEFALYGAALSAKEIAEIYENGKP